MTQQASKHSGLSRLLETYMLEGGYEIHKLLLSSTHVLFITHTHTIVNGLK